MKRKYAIYPYWVHVIIAASMGIAFAWFLFWLGGWSYDVYHRPILGSFGVSVIFAALMCYIEFKSRRINREHADGNTEIHQR